MALAALGTALAAASWLRWSDALIDTGRVLYVPWRLLRGDLLYRDVEHLFGPLTPYLDALLFRLFGTGVRTLALFNLAVVALLTVLVVRGFGRLHGRAAGAGCGAIFLAVFAFGHTLETGNYNFIGPYAPELTHAILVSFLMLPALERGLRGSRAWAGLAGLLLGLVFLEKVEVLVAALWAVAAGFAVRGLQGRAGREAAMRAAAPLLAGFAAPLLAFAVFFAARATPGEAVGMVFAGVTSVGRAGYAASRFYQRVAGLDAPGRNLLVMAAAAAGYGALVLLFAALARQASRLRGAARLLPGAAGALGLLVVAALLWDRFDLWDQAARPLPVLLAAHLALTLRRAARERREGGGELAPGEVALPVFALLLLLKVFLAVRLSHYGFALAMPGALLAGSLLLGALPEHAVRRGWSAPTARALAGTLLMLIAVRHTAQSLHWYGLHTYPLGGGADRMFTLDPAYSGFGPAMRKTLRYLREEVPPGASFLALPSGVILNYLSRRRSPVRWYDFTPPDLAAGREERMIEDLARARPGHVLLIARPTAEFGAPRFGRDYGRELWTWVRRNYHPVYQAGAVPFAGRGFGILVTRRTGLHTRRPAIVGSPHPPVMTRQ